MVVDVIRSGVRHWTAARGSGSVGGWISGKPDSQKKASRGTRLEGGGVIFSLDRSFACSFADVVSVCSARTRAVVVCRQLQPEPVFSCVVVVFDDATLAAAAVFLRFLCAYLRIRRRLHCRC